VSSYRFTIVVSEHIISADEDGTAIADARVIERDLVSRGFTNYNVKVEKNKLTSEWIPICPTY